MNSSRARISGSGSDERINHVVTNVMHRNVRVRVLDRVRFPRGPIHEHGGSLSCPGRSADRGSRGSEPVDTEAFVKLVHVRVTFELISQVSACACTTART